MIEDQTTYGWPEFAIELIDALANMEDAEDPDVAGDHLLIELNASKTSERDGRGAPYVHFAATDDSATLQAEISGNAHLTEGWQMTNDQLTFLRDLGWVGHDDEAPNWFMEVPLGDHHHLVAMVVVILRDCFGISSPQLMTYRAFGPTLDSGVTLSLEPTGNIPTEEDERLPALDAHIAECLSDGSSIPVTDHDVLHLVVHRTLCAILGTDIVVDDDGDFEIPGMGQPTWVVVRKDRPTVQILTNLVLGIHSRRATAVEIGILNRDNPVLRWTLHDRTVVLSGSIHGEPFTPRHLDQLIGEFVGALGTRHDLGLRTGGRVA